MSRASRLGLIALLGGIAFVAIACTSARPGNAVQVASGLISHNLCSEVFVTGVPPDLAYAQSLAPRPGMGLVNWAVRFDVDRAQAEVRTTIAGGFESRAVYHDGLGCLLLQGDEPPDLPTAGASAGWEDAALLPEIAGAEVVAPADERLRAALDHAFSEPGHPPHEWTRAVVVVHDGRVVAERYAPGFGVDTPLLGYSASKSVISALLGILVRQGRLAMDRPAPVEAWSGAGDARGSITADHLLRMTSGLALTESGSPLSPVARMLYLERDMASFAEGAELEAPPGTRWTYTSGNTIILSRIVRDAVGGHASDVLRFARRELFEPLGMRHVTIEFDATGTPVGSTYMLMPARDWARFGILYLNDGVVGGQHLLPEGWVKDSTTPTLDTGYGAGFWTDLVGGRIPWSPVPWGIPGAPREAFFARGMLGQYVVVVPSAQLVVARFGVSHDSTAAVEGVGRLVDEVLDALGAPGSGADALTTDPGDGSLPRR